MEKDEIFERMHHCRQALLGTLGKIPPDLQNHEIVEGNWTIKEVLCHLTAWDLSVLEPLLAFTQSGEFKPDEIPDHDAWNAHQTAKRQSMSLPQVLDELEATRAQLLDQAARLSPEQWEQVLPAPWGGQGCIANLLNGLAWHENEHLQTIQIWRQNQLHPE